MARQSLVWTALPNGYTADGMALRLSVLLSPRLDPQADPQRLDSFFPDWQDWPQTLRKATFTVTCNGATVSVAGDGSGTTNRLDSRLGLADSAAWHALFKPGLLVRPYAFTDLSNRTLRSYDAAAAAELVQSLYRGLALAADGNMPLITNFIVSDDWAEIIDAVSRLDSPRWEPGLLPHGSVAANPPTPLETLARFKDFHTPLPARTVRHQVRQDDPRIAATWHEHNRPSMPTPDDLGKQLDFHQIVATMGSYPTLLRRLGLVVDMLLDPGGFPSGNDVDLSVEVEFPPGALVITRTADGMPTTRTQLSATVFRATSDPAAAFPLKDGLLNLDPARFALLQADVDGAGLKLMNFARSLQRRTAIAARVDPVTRKENEIGAPTLRTAGLMLVQKQRAAWLTARFVANQQRNTTLQGQMQGTPGVVPLHAEDLVRGYRIDIFDTKTGAWASLCRRTARYELDGTVVVEPMPEEESAVRLATTTSPDPTSNPDVISLHEALVTWSGWSLAAPPPGRNIRPDDSVDTAPTQSEAEVPPGINFVSRFKPVPFSLPRLRFGRLYWMRARAVDLAGNSLDPQPASFGSEQPSANAQPFLRYEPVAAPALALLSQDGTIEVPGPGESMARMAIRSFNDTAADNTQPSTEQAHRAAVPPRVSAREAEYHGMLDQGGRVDKTTFQMLSQDKDLDGRDPNAVVREVRLPSGGPLSSTASDTSFAVYELGRAMTYLPDPLAADVAVRLFDHPNIDAGEIITIPFYPEGSWPDARPFVAELYEDAVEKPHYDPTRHVLRVPLPKAVRARIRLSMKLDDARLALMGVFAWLDAAGQTAQRQRAQDGQHWMLTPWQVLEVVHAVQRPLKSPDISQISVLPRQPGDTHALPMIAVECSIASTDRLDLLAEWHEPIDEAAAPSDSQRRDTAFHIKVTDDTMYATALKGALAGGFPDHTISGPDLVAINTQDPRVASKAHEFHDSRYRRIEYWFDATTRFREFLPPELLTEPGPDGPVPTDQHIKVSGARSVAWIPSSAPPPAPKLLYAVPTFAWSRDEDDAGNAVSQRRGGGLRIYLNRPWNASGYGEMLAVVLPPADFSGDPDTMPLGHPMRKYATQWGNDPVWDSAFVSGLAPRRADFTLARTAPDPQGAWLPPGAPQTEADQPPGAFNVTGLQPPGVSAGDLALDIAPHDVAWDAERQLWYCDIAVDPAAAYFPFIRLALARYQPISTSGTHLSNIVLADVMALAPNRWLAVATTQDSRSRQVTVTGYRYVASSGWQEANRAQPSVPPVVAKTSVVEVWVEQLEPRLGSDFGWQPLAGAVVTPAMVPPPTGNAAEVLWTGQVTIPEAADDIRPYRLVVAEYEEYAVDGPRPYDPVPTRKGRRLVFVEHYSLAL
jgi:hypothetical protein